MKLAHSLKMELLPRIRKLRVSRRLIVCIVVWAFVLPVLFLLLGRTRVTPPPHSQLLGELLRKWSPDVVTSPPGYTSTPLPRFDMSTPDGLRAALSERDLGHPIILTHMPMPHTPWDEAYLTQQFAQHTDMLDVDSSSNNRFTWFSHNKTKQHKQTRRPREPIPEMSFICSPLLLLFLCYVCCCCSIRYVRSSQLPADFAHPTVDVRMNFAEFVKRSNFFSTAIDTDSDSGSDTPLASKRKHTDPHYYLQVASIHQGYTWMKDDLREFTQHPFISQDHIGTEDVECRFSQEGVVAEPHFDIGLNVVWMLRGRRRYVLVPPDYCASMNVVRTGPFQRRSHLNWADQKTQKMFDAQHVHAYDIQLEVGEALFIPNSYFHLIISLTPSVQCNVREFVGFPFSTPIPLCGFDDPTAGEKPEEPIHDMVYRDREEDTEIEPPQIHDMVRPHDMVYRPMIFRDMAVRQEDRVRM
jgi:hypothetical protein